MRRAARLVAAVVLAAATATIVPPASPAAAAACSSADGVTLVVDFHELGGGVSQVCDPDGGDRSAAELFPANGFPLTYVQRQPGFVCRVSGKPTSEQESCVNTPPADAYWGLWWTDGESGTWSYSSEGASSLSVPDGGSMAFSWNGSSTKSPPGVAAPTHEDEPSPSPQPSSPPGGGGGGPGPGGGSDPSSPGSTAPGSATSSASTSPDGSGTTAPGDGPTSDGSGPGDKDGKGGQGEGPQGDGKGGKGGQDDRAEESPDPSASASTTTDAVADPPSDAGDDGLPAWVAPAGIAALFGAAGVVALLRRRQGAPS